MHTSSRKINRKLSAKALINEEKVENNAMAFSLETNDKFRELQLGDDCVWNSDQSGFEYELMRDRAIASKGEKLVETIVVDANASTHTYSIQVHLSKAGQLGKKIFLVLQEPTGPTFGPRVQEAVSELLKVCKNVEVACSKSGKFTTQIAQRWFSDVFAKNVEGNAMLLLDAWPGQGPNAKLDLPGVSVAYIPKFVQPLDVYFFRAYKILVKKKVYEECRDAFLDGESQEKPGNRFLTIKIHSVCYNQMCHPRFSQMWKYAWQKALCEVDDPVSSFENVSKILLDSLKSRDAYCDQHSKFPIFQCVYCSHYICWECFCDPIHLHDLI